jgi:RimJ/RimL family protein N-acetyltransferase
MKVIIETKRLILRTWLTKDIESFYLINQDPKVIECLPGSLSKEEVENFIAAKNKQQDTRGFTLWAVELKETHDLIGFIGLNYTDWGSKFTPAVEVGWRLGSQYWDNGYATEGAKAALKYAFEKVGLNAIISFTVPENVRSIRIMEKIGLNRDIDGDFNHPKLSFDHKLSKHVLYRMSREQYLEREVTNDV